MLKNIKKLISVALISMVFITVSGCNMVTKTQAGIDKGVVAKVKDQTITRGQLDKKFEESGAIQQLKAQYGENYAKDEKVKEQLKQQKDQLLDSMITQMVVAQQAKEQKIVPTDADVKKARDEQYQTVRKSYPTEDEWNKVLTANKLTDAALKERINKQLTAEYVAGSKLQEAIFKTVKVDDKAVQDEYNKNQAKYTEQPNKIQLAHILVATEAEAKKVSERIKTEDFAKVAKEVSTDTGSKDKGGDLGEVDEANTGFVPEFTTAALALKEGEISAPVKTQYGFHIIKCIKKTEFPVKKFEAVKDEIKQTLLSQKQQQTFQDKIKVWKDAAKITKYPENLL